MAASITPSETGLTYDPQCGGETLDARVQFGCGSIREQVDPGCAQCRLYHGSRLAQETCTTSNDGLYDDCDRGLACDATGVCVDPCGLALEGENCSARSCAAGLFCHFSIPDELEPVSVCRPAADLDEACDVDRECLEGLACSYSTQACVEWSGAQAGQPCELGCAEGLQCDSENPNAPVCRPLGAEGEACIGAADCASGRCDSGSQTCDAEQAMACLG